MTVPSRDGAPTAAQRFGHGSPALVVIPGALSSENAWAGAVGLLSAGRHVIVLDRRGDGHDASGVDHASEREVEHVLAFMDTLGAPTDLLGHSSGAILALHAASRRSPRLRRLVVYEPPVFFRDEDRVPADLPERLDSLLASSNPDEAMAAFLREGLRMPDEELGGIRADHRWARLVAMAPTLPNEARIQRDLGDQIDRPLDIRVPTLMLIGAASPDRMRTGARSVASAIPGSVIEELAGQEHLAMIHDVEAFARVVDAFLVDADG